jgi:hypothetical protein
MLVPPSSFLVLPGTSYRTSSGRSSQTESRRHPTNPPTSLALVARRSPSEARRRSPRPRARGNRWRDFPPEGAEPRQQSRLTGGRPRRFPRGRVPAEGDPDGVAPGLCPRMDHLPEDHPTLTRGIAAPGGEHQPDDFPRAQRTVEHQARATAAEVGQRTLEGWAAAQSTHDDATPTPTTLEDARTLHGHSDPLRTDEGKGMIRPSRLRRYSATPHIPSLGQVSGRCGHRRPGFSREAASLLHAYLPGDANDQRSQPGIDFERPSHSAREKS